MARRAGDILPSNVICLEDLFLNTTVASHVVISTNQEFLKN